MALSRTALVNAPNKAQSLQIVAAILVFLLGSIMSPLRLFQSSNFSPLAQLPAPDGEAPATISHRPSADLITFPSSCRPPVSSNLVRNLVLAKLFDGISPFEGFPPEYARPWLSEKRISGWGSYDPVFSRLITEVKPKVILELGTFLGASATHMATVSKSQGRDVLVLCIDHFRGWPGFRDKIKLPQIHGDVQLLYQFLQNVHALNLTESILPIPFSTTAVMIALCQWGVYGDLVEVDAEHDFHSAWTDINHAYMVLKPGGVMFGDDYYWSDDVGKAVRLFAKLKGFRVETDGRHWILRSN